MTTGLVFEGKTHRYFLDGVRVPSTTGILGAIAKPFLIDWYGKHGTAEAKRMSKEAADHGTAVHAACERVANAEYLPTDYYDRPTMSNSVAEYNDWFKAHVSRVVLCETPIASRLHQMAGTPDLAAVLKGKIEVRRLGGKIETVDMDGETGVLDLKTSTSVGEDFGLQLEGYRRMLREWLGIEATRRLVIHMPRKTPGKLEVVEFEMSTELDDWRAFLSALVIWHRLFKAKAFAPRNVGRLAAPAPAAGGGS